MRRALTDFDEPTLAALLQERGLRASHARRLLVALHRDAGALNLEGLDVGRGVRELFERELKPRGAQVVRRHESEDGTVKLLLGLDAGGTVETVLMPAHRPDRAAGCVSSQIGCAMRCDFCASTRNGLERDLSAGEIVEQWLELSRAARALGRRIASLVFMGMGEPMHNLDNVVAAINRIADPAFGGIGWRAMTVSTVGVVPGIERLAAMDLGVHLALSLHAPDDATRSRLVPMNRRWKVADVVAAARAFQQRTGRIVTVEYCMLAGVNDSDEQAHLLADLVDGWRAHVNLIPYNAIGTGVSGVIYQKPTPQRIERFASILSERGAVTHVRRTRGDDVNAACGQLRQATAVMLPVLASLPDA